MMAHQEDGGARRPIAGVASGVAGLLLASVGLSAFNLGYVGLYGAFIPLLCVGMVLRVDVGEDFFLSLLLLAVTGTLLYAVGLFALPLIVACVGLMIPAIRVLQRWGFGSIPETVRKDPRPGWRTLELLSVLLVALFGRYVVYRSGGGTFPLQIGEFESLTRFVIGEVGGWVVFAFGYGLQHRSRYRLLYSPGLDFASSLPALLATGLFLISPHVAIMTLGLNTFGMAGLYVGTLPVGAAHVLMRTLTLRRSEIERQNQRLQQMNLELARNERMAAIGQMSSTISHQILQKLGLLGLQCDLLRDALADETAAGPSPVDEARERVEQLDAAINDLNTTLSDLLVFSREVALHLENCSIDALVRELVNETRAAATTRGVDIVYDGGTEVGNLSIDRIKLKQALLNLLTNALDASSSPGRVDVSVSASHRTVQLSITDQGTGIGEMDIVQLATPFFSTKSTGTGLGLTFVQRIVELHQGILSARNNPDGGATFCIEIPRPGRGEEQ